jgi:hypothetical protein
LCGRGGTGCPYALLDPRELHAQTLELKQFECAVCESCVWLHASNAGKRLMIEG